MYVLRVVFAYCVGKKSLEGTLAMFSICFIVGSILFWSVPFSDYIIFVGATTATLMELFNPTWLDDNLTIPISAALALHLAFVRLGTVPPPLT